MTAQPGSYKYGRLRLHFFDVEVPVVIMGKSVYFPIKALCKVLGVASQGQIYRIRGDSRMADAICTLPVPTVKGIRDTECLHKGVTSIFITTIDPARCKVTTKGTLSQFQAELFRAADRFLFGDTGQSVVTGPVLLGTIKAGPCPHCGTHLQLEISDSGVHLREDLEQE